MNFGLWHGVREFSENMSPATDPDEVIIDFEEALNALTERYRKAGKRLRLRHLSPDCRSLITAAGSLILIEVAKDDPHYSVVRM